MSASNVTKALRLCEGRDGHLDADGRLIAHDVRKARQFRHWGMHEVAADYQAEAERIARSVIASRESLRKACLTPITARGGR